MDRSYEFKRFSLYWRSFERGNYEEDLDISVSMDKFSLISSIVYSQLITLDFVISPYKLYYDVNYKDSKGKILLPNIPNISRFIQLKRRAFNEIGIEAIVHDTKIINEFINQLENTLCTEYSTKDFLQSVRVLNNKNSNKRNIIIEYKYGILECLKYLFQIVSNNIQEYERFKLKLESQLNTNLQLLTDNITEYRDISSSNNSDYRIPYNYLSCFFIPNTSTASQSPCTKGYISPQKIKMNHI